MIRKTTTFAELLAACPYIKIKRKLGSSIQVAAWLEARLAEKGIQLAAEDEYGVKLYRLTKEGKFLEVLPLLQVTDHIT